MSPVLSAVMNSFAEQWHCSEGFLVSSILTKASPAGVCSVVSWAETALLCASCSPQSISVTSSALAPNPSDVEGPRVGNQLIWNKIKPTHLPKESIEIVGKELEICESEGWAAHNTDRCLPKLCRIFKLLPAKIQVQRWSLPHLTSSAVSCLVLH